MHSTTFPVLLSNRLRLRNIDASDHEMILFLRSDKEVNRFIERPANRQTRTKKDALEFIERLDQGREENKFIAWGITLKDNPQLIGTICLWNFSEDMKTAEVGYDLHPSYQKKGIMSEALQLVLDFGFEKIDLSTIEAYTHVDNKNSWSLLEKNGFKFLPYRRDEGFDHNRVFSIQQTAHNKV